MRAAIVLFCAVWLAGAADRPNIVFIITDDQDWTLAHWDTVPVVRKMIAEEGVTLSNYFPTTPICCPSRSEMLSGRFAHNIRDDHFEPYFGCFLPTSEDCGCMRMNTSQDFHRHNFGVFLKKAGYNTAWFGKYLNYPGIKDFCDTQKQGVTPPGWDFIDMYCNDTYGPSYWNKNGKVYHSNEYTTAHMGNSSVDWLTQTLKNNKTTPFFMTVAPHAPHAPYTPAPWYVNATVPSTPYPRLPWFGTKAVGHVPWLEAEPALAAADVAEAEHAYYERFRALMAVDDVVREVMRLLETSGVINNTYVFFTSDHGHHVGEFRMSEGKSHAFEFDIRVPFAVRGPGLPKNSTLPILASNIDLAPTFLDLAGAAIPSRMDGQSFAHLLRNPTAWFNPGAEVGPVEPSKQVAGWNREALLLEYYTIFPFPDDYEAGVTRINDCQNNTWRALRFMSQEYGNLMYIEYTQVHDWFFENVIFHSLFDVAKDPYELNNIYGQSLPQLKQELRDLMVKSFSCTGNDTARSNCTMPFPGSDFARSIFV